jgi:uncharacterized lipoprotein YddW (UPF0748 family)
MLATIILWCSSAHADQSDLYNKPVRLRIGCGGLEPHRWSGTVRLEGGTLSELQLLSVEADAAATVWLEGNTIHFSPRRPRRRDAVDVTVTGTADSRLMVEMKADPAAPLVSKSIVLRDLFHSQAYLPLDDQGHAVVVQRAPGDELRIVTQRKSLIFAPGEQFKFDVEPAVVEIEPSTSIDVEATMSAARGRSTLWSHQQRILVPVTGPAIATLHVPLPRQEGVYQINVTLSRPAGFTNRFLPGARNKSLAQRSFQVVVLDPEPPAPATDATWQPVIDIDPANPRWWERLPDWTQIRRIPGVSPRPLGSSRAEVVDDPAGKSVRLAPTASGGEPHWQAYALPLETVGVPHLLEVEYPSDLEQHLGFSILEPNAAGKVVPIGRDSGVYVEGIGHADARERHRHRIVFWPRTNSPLLLVTNQHPTAAGRFGQIRILRRTTNSIASEPWPQNATHDRLVAAYWSRPLVPETFGASEGLDVTSGESVEDWQTHYEGSTRLADYLNYAGFNTATVNVMADGSSVFPCRQLQATPRYNSSRMAAATRDLPEIDPLELQLRVFDRSGLALVPTLQFATPLPELETLRRGVDPQASGLELIGPSGRAWVESQGAVRGLAPYYNLLDPRVQEAMKNVVAELVNRYGHHPSLAGVAVQLSGNGFAVVPGLEWGIDDMTIARFERDTGIEIPSNERSRFSNRQALLQADHAEAWRSWRAANVTNFYRQLSAVVQSNNPRRRLLLTTEELFTTPQLAERFRPKLTGSPRIDRALVDVGIDRSQLAHLPGLVVCPTRYEEPMNPLVDQAIEMSISEAFAAAARPRTPSTITAATIYHPPRRVRMDSFDTKSPFESTTRLVVQSSADAARSRRPYVAALRGQVPDVLLDGGQLLPLGQEDSIRQLRRLMRDLPTDDAPRIERDKNVTVQSYESLRGTVCVVVNECPWPSEVELALDVPVQVTARSLTESFAPESSLGRLEFFPGTQKWSLKLAAYDVAAVRFPTMGVRVEGVVATIGEEGHRELAEWLADLRGRDRTAIQTYGGLVNPGFEPAGDGRLSGWRLASNSTHASADLDANSPQEGASSLALRNAAANEVAALESDSFATPPTGQLVMTVFVRSEHVEPGTELHLVFETEGDATPYRREAFLGGNRPGAIPLGPDWNYFAFRSEDLPLDSRGQMRVKFELAGAGNVRIDNVQLYDLLFPLPFYEHAQQQRLRLVQLIYAADKAQEKGDLAECVELLEGYWPRFLTAYTPMVQPAIAQRPANQPALPPATKDEAEKPSWWFWKR